MKRILPIISFILLITFSATAQVSRESRPEADKSVKFYPNPATANITFDLQKLYQKGLTLSIYSFLGKKMYESQNIQEKTTIPVTDYNRGVYIFHITDASGKLVDTGKFQVSK
ncbi:MAG: T9SS type A sorting domain-containing protein [Chitinophagaceae bacterium]|nr:T9SS type A sorting domain-containing protein [Chitinophagaceae bacterium]